MHSHRPSSANFAIAPNLPGTSAPQAHVPERPQQPPFLQVRDAVVRRAGKDILAIDQLTIEEGESICLLGPNGAGKSTFIHLITREALPLHRDTPPVLFRGQERPVLQEVRAAMGIVSPSMQEQITVHLPALEVVIGGLYGVLGMPRRIEVTPADRQRALNTMEQLGIASLADRDIMTLSTGQARRVLIARALVSNPSAIIFDEPCTGLDPEGMFYVRQCMRAVVQSGRAVLLVTHYPEDIIPEIQRLLLVKEGRIIADGPKRQLLTDSAMSSLFDIPLQVHKEGEYCSLFGEY